MPVGVQNRLASGASAAAMPRRRESSGQVAKMLPILLLAYSVLLLPPEVRISFFGVNLPMYRIIIIGFALPWLVIFERRRFKLGVADGLILAACGWMIVSFTHHYGFGVGFVRAMGVVIDTGGGYFVARFCIRSPNDLRKFLLLIIPALTISGFFMAAESFTKNFIVRPAFASIFGQVAAYSAGAADGVLEIRKEFRLGLMRAFASFSHPILGGVILTSTIILYLTSSIRSWPKYVAIFAGLFGFFSLSSATIISIMLSFTVFFSDKLLSYVKTASWRSVAAFVFIVGMILQVSSQKGIITVLIRQTIDPQTGYYRLAIWEWGMRSIQHNLVYGIGYADYERPMSLLPSASVDAHFLALGIRDGAFVPLALLAALVITFVVLGGVVGRAKGPDRKMLFGMNAALFGLFVASMTVTFFGEGAIWFMALVGMGASLAQFRPGTPPFAQQAGRPVMPQIAGQGR